MVSLLTIGVVLTFWIGDNEFVVPMKFRSPAYSATTVCVPCDSELVLNVATPPDNVFVSAAVPSIRNTTGPVGVPAPGETAVSVAVNVTFEPGSDGFSEDATISDESACVIVSVPAT